MREGRRSSQGQSPVGRLSRQPEEAASDRGGDEWLAMDRGPSRLVFRRRGTTTGEICCAWESACGQSTSGSTLGGRCDSWVGLDGTLGVGVGEEKEQVRHCKPGYLEQQQREKKWGSECRQLVFEYGRGKSKQATE